MCFAGLVYRTLLFSLILCFNPVWTSAQTGQFQGSNGNPQKGVFFPGNSEEPRFTVENQRDLCLGAFYPGRFGGSLEITSSGVRSSSGSTVLVYSELNPSPAMFEIRCPGNTMVNIVLDEEIVLSNSNGGTLICEPIINGQSNFVSAHNAQAGFPYSIGARLNMLPGGSEPSGEYSGTFNITIVLE